MLSVTDSASPGNQELRVSLISRQALDVPRAPLGNSCFRLQKDEKVVVPLYYFDYPARMREVCIRVLEWAYWNYHEEPCRPCGVQETVSNVAQPLVKMRGWLGSVLIGTVG